jgi:hypothetical protein
MANLDVAKINQELQTNLAKRPNETVKALQKNKMLHEKINETLSQSCKFFKWFAESNDLPG